MDYNRKKPTTKNAKPRKTNGKVQNSDNDSISPADMTQLQILILQKLQTSLEVDQLLNHFTDSLSELTGLQRVSFHPVFTSPPLETSPESGFIQHLKLFTGENYIGQLNIEFDAEPDEQASQITAEAAKLIAFPLQHALDYQQALKCSEQDTLTSLKNRNAMDHAIIKACDASKRYKTDLSILMVDIDHFKKINDTYGHVNGDKVLQRLASILKQSCRLADEAFRYGGEEFLMILPNTPAEGAMETAERIRKSIEFNDFGGILEEKDLPVTVSIGVDQYDQAQDIDSFINRADQALYAAKRAGRNQTLLYANEILA